MNRATASETATSDADLLARFQAGEQRSFDLLFERYHVGVTRYATRMLRDPEEGHDVAIDAFVRVLDGRLQPRSSLRSLLYTTVHRLCLDRLRRRTRWARVRRLWSAAPPRSITPLSEVQDREDARRLAHAIDELSSVHRSAVLLVYEEGLPTCDAADVLGLTPEQLRSKLSYARKLLRRDLEVP